ncbi:3-dehydroquinate synthase [Pelagibacteraceae bacterium]|nr:3-dehydroquinate synthase [Pelagibacteraceae bacterium]
MIKKINILVNKNKYSIEIESNSINKKIKHIISNNNNVIFLIDKKVFNVFKKINNYHKKKYICINCSEKIKSFNFYNELTQKILSKGVDRKTVLVAIGGGTLGDLSGFIASTLLRGIDLILVPTTLLSQVDSSIGGKNGINTKFGKNLIGTFYQPRLVIIDPFFLKTLSKRELLSGYAEIVKHSLIYDEKFFNWLDKNSKSIFNLNYKVISKAIYKSILIKKQYVLKDEKERLKNQYSRAILNFGHTFGHALETYYKYNNKLTHGEAISIGMIIAATISYNLNYLSYKNLMKIKNHFINNKLPVMDNKIYDEKIFKIIHKDKKNIDGKINFVLLKGIGNSFLKNNINLNNIKKLTK